MSRGDTPVDRILGALNHPIRRQILRALVDKPGSAKALSRQFNQELGVVSCHLNKVLARECHVIELVDSVPRRGAIEKFYCLKPEAWAGLPAIRQPDERADGLRRLSLGECLLESLEAMEAETFAELDGSAWDWFPVTVDDKAWKAIRKAREDFNKRLEAAVEESRKRAERRKSGGDEHEVVVGVVAFPTARSVSEA